MNTMSVTQQANVAPFHLPGTNIASPGATGYSAAMERQQALQKTYDAYMEQIYRFIYFKVGNREDAEDITSHVFIKAAHSLDVTQEEQSKLAWLYQVARTTITDHWRNFYKGPVASLEQMEEDSPLHLSAGPLILAGVDDRDVEPAVEKV